MKIFSVFVVLWGSLVSVGPWLIGSAKDMGDVVTYTIVSGLGGLIILSGFVMLDRSQALRQADSLTPIAHPRSDDSDSAEELTGGWPWSSV